MTTRRQFLVATGASASVLLGGCLDTIRSESESPRVETEIIDIGEIADIPVAFNVSQTSTLLSGEELPRFSVTLENEGDNTLWFHNGRPRLFSPGPSTPEGLYLLSESEADSIEDGTSEVAPADPADCLWIDHPPARPADEPQVTLHPGEPESQEFAYAPDEDVSGEGCPESEEYAFEENYRFYLDERDERDEPTYVAEWGFGVRIRGE